MQEQNGTKEDVTLNTQNSVEETHNNDYLSDEVKLANGLIIRRRNDKWFTTLGDTIISEPTKTYSEQLKQIDEINYELLIKMMVHVNKVMNKVQDKKAKTPYETESL